MAGLTREQRAERAALLAITEQRDDGLITVINGADELRIHPTCLKAHQSQGWTPKETS